jgi:hypothetical protein
MRYRPPVHTVALRRLTRTVAVAAVMLAGGNAATDEPANPASLLEAPEPIAAALRSRFGKNLQIRSLSVRADSADVEIQDAAMPENLDRYSFEDGALGTPEPVQAGRNLRKLKASLFPFAEVDLSILPRLVADALLRAKTTDARVAQVRIERSTGYGSSDTWGWPRIGVIVDGPRGGAVVEYDLEGKHKSTKRW